MSRIYKGENVLFSQTMIALIWIVFYMLNVVLLLVVLMNFLIAIVSDTYYSVKEKQLNTTY